MPLKGTEKPETPLTSEQQKLVVNNQGLVGFVIHRQMRGRPWGSLTFEDLKAEGTFGLMRAAMLFDPKRDVAFATYAVFWVRAKIHRLLDRQWRVAHPYVDYRTVVVTTTGKGQPSRGLARTTMLSLNDPIVAGASDGDKTLGDTVSSFDANPEEILADKVTGNVLRKHVNQVLRKMDDPRAWIVAHRRLLSDGNPRNQKNSDDGMDSLDSIGKDLGLSREGVRQIEIEITGRLRARRRRIAEELGLELTEKEAA